MSRKGTKLIHVSPYAKNLSISRIKSYLGFAKECSNIIGQKTDIDLLYLLAPPNVLIKELSALKKKLNFKFIVEIGDMWPESLPVSSWIKRLGYPVFEIWRLIRDKHLNDADYVVTECDLFLDNLKKHGLFIPSRRLYFCKEAIYEELLDIEYKDEIRLCYIGSINNIIDIEYIKRLVQKVATIKKITVHIIGKGENEKSLCEAIINAGGKCEFYGPIYDNKEKFDIVSNCHFALNIMKNNVFVGMTMKSLDYFSMGLPIINNIVGDTWDVVEQYECGINGKNPEAVAKRIINMSFNDVNSVRLNARNVHKELFSIDQFDYHMKEIIDFLLKENNS